ncbi:MAG TPA: hypothetical protein VEC16_06170 [Alphaproteobacteria bacterium]|nr:hypothetical protein [Alphaproteobacteria bacterium]
MQSQKRSLLSITLEEAIRAVEIAGGINSQERSEREYFLEHTGDVFLDDKKDIAHYPYLKQEKFVQLCYYVGKDKYSEKHIAAAFSDTHDIVVIRDGYNVDAAEKMVHSYLAGRGFNVVDALSKPDRYKRREDYKLISDSEVNKEELNKIYFRPTTSFSTSELHKVRKTK